MNEISKEQLKAWGMKETEDPGFPLKKVLGNDLDGGELSLCVTMVYNEPRFALVLPDGAMVMLNQATFDELKAFENMIVSYEPVW